MNYGMNQKITSTAVKLLFFIILTSYFIIPIAVSAQDAVIHNPVEVDSINEYVEMAVGSLLKILGPIVVLFMVLSGVMFALARGNPEKLAEAKRMLLYTMIGAAIVFGAWLLAELVTDTLALITE